ncbi:reverse transcriptase domain-containing protein [Pseudomonas chlororaphis subsp. aurantiaca]|uniref:reverse transcriptase domain-containing protein n=1 Tax=Pseudomonas chlororaphis TaxID=587753 RepID=UPI00398A70C8
MASTPFKELSFLDLILPKPKIKNNKELADALGISVGRLTYYAYFLPDSKKYKDFKISKRGGGERLIEAPVKGLKDIQRTILKSFESSFKPRSCVFSYIQGRGIVENADTHDQQRWVLRVDLKDFFNTITQKRVIGVFSNPPFHLSREAARTISYLCTKDGRLPQGSPTSPLISNIVCRGLDYKLKELAAKNKCYYTRYADDIFFSYSGSTFPKSIAERFEDGSVELHEPLITVIEQAGFIVNEEKAYLRSRAERQIVTGLVVNRKVNVPKEYIRSIRAALYAWEKFGLELAEEHWQKKIDRKDRPTSEKPRFKWVIRGQINHVGHVKGYSDPVFLGLARRLHELDPDYSLDEKKITTAIAQEIHIYTEGITDNKHLKKAYEHFRKKGDLNEINLTFKETKKTGSSALKSLCENLSEGLQRHLTICIFDRDEKDIINSMGGSPGNYKDHGNNVFSLLLPAPDFRENQQICIEHLYKDDTLLREDNEGRRLFTKDEFDHVSCFRGERQLFCRLPNKQSLIYDSEIIDMQKKVNVALSKNKFADHILNETPPFINVDFSGFLDTFRQILEIANSYRKRK